MGANLELDIFLKKERFSLKPLWSALDMHGLHISIEHMQIFDNWQYEHMTTIDPASLDIETSDILVTKFTLLRLEINNTWKCTLITSFEDEYVNLSFGIDSNVLIARAHNDIDSSLLFLYNKATDLMNDSLSQKSLAESFLAASMGLEYSVDFHNNIMEMLQEDNGVVRWIVPKTTEEAIFSEKFTKKQKSNCIVFTRLDRSQGDIA